MHQRNQRKELHELLGQIGQSGGGPREQQISSQDIENQGRNLQYYDYYYYYYGSNSPYSPQYWNETSSLQPAGVHPCQEYETYPGMPGVQNLDKCKRCDSSRYYYRMLRNITHVMCCYYGPEAKRCQLRIEHYPYDGYIINQTMILSSYQGIPVPAMQQIDKDDGSGTKETVYFSKELFFQAENILTCSNYYYLYKTPETTALVTIFSYLEKYIVCYDCSVENYESEVITKVTGLKMQIGACQQGGNTCKYYQYYDQSSKACKSCSDLFPNCAACDGTTCSLCLDGFYLNDRVYDYAKGTYRRMCIYDQCPVGTCKDANSSSCITSTLSNCLVCQTKYPQYYNYYQSQGWYAQTCTLCAKSYQPTYKMLNIPNSDPYGYGYYQTMDVNECTQQSWNLNVGKETATQITYNFFVASSLDMQPPQSPPPDQSNGMGGSYSSQPVETYRTGLSPQNASYNIQSVLDILYFLSQPDYSTKKIIANIYIGKGEHFFMQCTTDTSKVAQQVGVYSPCSTNDSVPLSFKTPPQSDLMEVTVKPLECKEREAIRSNQVYETLDDQVFSSMCLDLDLTVDNRPIIYVNDAQAYFNITGNWTFQNLKFTGVNQLAQSFQKGVRLSALNRKLCKVVEMTKNTQYDWYINTDVVDSNFAYNKAGYYCDGGYQFVGIPNNDNYTYCGSYDYYSFGDYLSEKYSTTKQSTLSCSGGIDDPLHFTYNKDTYSYLYRKKTLFNLYGLAEYLSLSNRPPKLSLQNCDFEYFLGYYESLINVQTESLTKGTAKILSYNGGDQSSMYYYGYYSYNGGSMFSKQSKDFYYANGQDRGAIIHIINSNFQDSRFCKGLIVYRPGYFEPEMRALTNLTHLFMTTTTKADRQSEIIIRDSNFVNLNAYYVVDALASYQGITPMLEISTNVIDPFQMPAFIHKGIVLNLEDFGGRVEVVGSRFERNMHFIPKFLYQYRDFAATGNSEAFLDSKVTQEYKLKYCDMQENKEKYFFNFGFSQDEDIEEFFDKFERLSVIYISRNKKSMIFTNNAFDSNIGTFGGAITINSPNQQQGYEANVAVIIRDNNFIKNMAYFSGNAIYVRPTLLKSKVQISVCGGLQISGNSFTQNIGTKIHNGGAISAVCKYIDDPNYDDYVATSGLKTNQMFTELYDSLQSKLTINMQEVRIEENDFTENFSGLKGSAVYVKYFSSININNNLLFQNGPVYATLERKYSPYSKHFLSYQSYTYKDSKCQDEFQFLADCDTSESQYLLMPRIRGAVHIEHCQNDFCLNAKDGFIQRLVISNTIFKQNDAGPAIDYQFVDSESNPAASQIYISGGLNNQITSCQFVQSSGQSERFFASLSSSSLKNFFPDDYFTRLTSSLIVIRINPTITTGFQQMITSISESNFIENKHIQVLGLTEASKYQGSLIKYINLAEQGQRFFPLLQLTECQVSGNSFLGLNSALISVKNAIMQSDTSVFTNNGYLSDELQKYQKQNFKFGSTEFQFVDYEFTKKQYFGVFYLEGTISFSKSLLQLPFETHQFLKNEFSFLSASLGSAIFLSIDQQDAYFEGNNFNYLFSEEGGSAISAAGQTSQTTIFMIRNQMKYTFSLMYGAIILEPQDALTTLRIYDSTFDNTYGVQNQAIFASQIAKVHLENVTFTKNPHDKGNSLSQQVKKQYSKTSGGGSLEDILSPKLINNFISNEIISEVGLVYIEMTKNEVELSYGGIVFQDVSYPYLKHSEIINCLFQGSTAKRFSAISSLQSNIRIYNDLSVSGKLGFKNNIAIEKGIIGIEGNSELIIQNVFIKDNYSKGMASGIYSSNSNLTMINTTLLNNTVDGLGTLSLEADSSFSCSLCNFMNNYGNDSSTIFANNNRLTKFVIKDSKFENNTSEANLINMFQSNGVIQNVQFTNNIAQKVNNGITLISSQLTFKDNQVRFTNPEYINRTSYDVDTGFFNLNYRSSLQISNSAFQNCRGAIAGVLYATGSSSVEITNGSVFNASYSQNGDTIFTSLAQSLTIKDSSFSDNTNSDLYLDQTPGKIQNTTFVNTFKESVKVSSSSIDLINNTFRDSVNFNSLGKGVFCNCLNATFINNTFQNLSAARGGAVFLLTAQSENLLQSKFSLEGNKFMNCTAQQGGAVLISDAVNATFKKNNFTGNRAHIIQPATAQTRTLSSKGLGGGVYYSCINDYLKELNQLCSVRFFNKNVFIENSAQDDGGALLWVTNPYDEDGSNIFKNNSAYYGGDVASFPQKLRIEFLDNGDVDVPTETTQTRSIDSDQLIAMSQRRNSNLRFLQEDFFFPHIAPGTPFSFLIKIMDQNGELYKTDSASKAVLKDASGNTDNRVSIYNGEVVAKEGIFNFSKVMVTAVPGSDISLKLDIQGLQTYGNDLDFLQSPIALDFGVRKCVAGEQLQADNSCKRCSYGTYLYDAPQKETYCKTCQKEATCYGGNVVAPLPHYWRSTNISENFIKCPNPFACLGGNETELTGVCASGYEGILCGQCIKFYKKAEQFKCSACPDNRTNTIQIVIVGVTAAILVSLMVRSTLNSATRKKPVYSVYLKIIANHLQIIGAIQNIDYNWPKAIQDFEDGQAQVTSSTDRIFSFDCFIMNNQVKNDENVTPVYYSKLLIFGILPGILAAVDFIYWFTISTIKGRDYSELRSKFTSTLVVLLFLVHPNIAKAMFLSFNCLEVDGVYRLREDISSICYNGVHLTYMLIVVIPSILIWAIGIPMFALALLIRNRRILGLMQKKQITESEQKEIMTLKVKYGFLFQGFNPRTFYWEIVIMFRKIFIIMSTVFFSTLSPELQVLIVLLIIILSMFLQIKFSPYYTTTLNKMENYSLQVAAVTLYSGMFYVTGRHYDYMNKDELNWFFLVLIILPNLVFTVYWALQMRIEILKEIHKFGKPILFRLLACGSYKKFMHQYIINEEQSGETQIIIKDDEVPEEFEDAQKLGNGQPQSKDMDAVFGVPMGEDAAQQDPLKLNDITLQIPSLDLKKILKNEGRKKRRFIEHIENEELPPTSQDLTENNGPSNFSSPHQNLEDQNSREMTMYKDDDTSQMNFNVQTQQNYQENTQSKNDGGLTSRSINKVFPLETFRTNNDIVTPRNDLNMPLTQRQAANEISPLDNFEGTFQKPQNLLTYRTPDSPNNRLHKPTRRGAALDRSDDDDSEPYPKHASHKHRSHRDHQGQHLSSSPRHRHQHRRQEELTSQKNEQQQITSHRSRRQRDQDDEEHYTYASISTFREQVPDSAVRSRSPRKEQASEMIESEVIERKRKKKRAEDDNDQVQIERSRKKSSKKHRKKEKE